MSDEDNVIRLLPRPADEGEERKKESIIKALEETMTQALEGNIDLLLIVGRQANGGVIVRASLPCDEVHAVGLCHTAAILMYTRMKKG